MALTADPDGPVTLQTVRRVALAFPEVEEGLAYGTPAFRVRGKFLGRMHDEGDALVLKIDAAERERLIEADPVTFFVTEHYVKYPYVLIRLATTSKEELGALFERAWRKEAPKSLVRDYRG